MMLQGIDALNRMAFDSAAHNLRTRSPISLPALAPITEDEDVKNLENLREILSIFNRSRSTSQVGTVAGMNGGKEASRPPTNSQFATRVQLPILTTLGEQLSSITLMYFINRSSTSNIQH